MISLCLYQRWQSCNSRLHAMLSAQTISRLARASETKQWQTHTHTHTHTRRFLYLAFLTDPTLNILHKLCKRIKFKYKFCVNLQYSFPEKICYKTLPYANTESYCRRMTSVVLWILYSYIRIGNNKPENNLLKTCRRIAKFYFKYSRQCRPLAIDKIVHIVKNKISLSRIYRPTLIWSMCIADKTNVKMQQVTLKFVLGRPYRLSTYFVEII